jgi:hypothetical protein
VSDFAIGLQVTALGMGLVFLTLVIVMLIIMVLDRLFRPKAGITEATVAAPVAGMALPVEAPSLCSGQAAATVSAAPAATEADALDEAAAIGVAIAAAVARRASIAPKPPLTRSSNPLFAPSAGDGDLPGEVVLVATIDGGSGIWARVGRLQAMN